MFGILASWNSGILQAAPHFGCQDVRCKVGCKQPAGSFAQTEVRFGSDFGGLWMIFARQRWLNYPWLQMKRFDNQATMLRKHWLKSQDERTERTVRRQEKSLQTVLNLWALPGSEFPLASCSACTSINHRQTLDVSTRFLSFLVPALAFWQWRAMHILCCFANTYSKQWLSWWYFWNVFVFLGGGKLVTSIPWYHSWRLFRSQPPQRNALQFLWRWHGFESQEWCNNLKRMWDRIA